MTHNAAASEAPDDIDRLLRMPDVERATGLRRGYIYRLIQREKFPAPVKLGIRASAWRASEVRAWINARPRAAAESRPIGKRSSMSGSDLSHPTP
jgi:prophage regulatory protein